MTFGLTPGDIGHRAVVRRLRPDGQASDLVGELLAVDAEQVTLRPDGTGPVTVARSAVVAERRVPPRAVRPRSAPADLQRLADTAEPGVERGHLGGWVLRAGGPSSEPVSAALALGDPGTSVTQALAAVQAFYRARALAPAILVVLPLHGPEDPAPGLDPTLADRGWVLERAGLMATADLRATPPRPDRRVHLRPVPAHAGPGWQRPTGPGPTHVPEQVLATVGDGVEVARGRGVLVRDWVGVSGLEVAAQEGDPGLGAAVLGQLLAWGAERGARWAYLRVRQDDAPVLATSAAAGFTPHHRYHVRRFAG